MIRAGMRVRLKETSYKLSEIDLTKVGVVTRVHDESRADVTWLRTIDGDVLFSRVGINRGQYALSRLAVCP